MLMMASGDDSPSCRLPKKGLDWFFVDTEACGGGTPDLGLPQGFLEFLGIFGAKRRCGRPTRRATPLAVPGAHGTAWWVFLTSCLPSSSFLVHTVSSGPEKIHKKFRFVWTPFDMDFL